MTASNINSLAALAWLNDAGADEAICDSPIDRLSATKPVEAASIHSPGTFARGDRPTDQRAPSGPVRPASPTTSGRMSLQSEGPDKRPAKVLDGDVDSVGMAMEIAAACNSLEELKAALETFDGCSLKRTATNTVFADGTPSRRIMLIGEAPGRDEDLAGLPFVGRAGKLLDKMLASIGLDRKANVYITNVLNWRPPGNRDPSPEEAAACLPFLRRHIELAAPAVIVLLGAVAARHVMGKNDGIMRLRGRWLEYYVSGAMVPVMPTLHPAYLLRRPIDKRLAWRDMLAIQEKVNSLGLLEEAPARG